MRQRGSSCSHIWPLQAHSGAPAPIPASVPGSPWDSHGMTAAEGVESNRFAEKGLFYCNYLESASWAGAGALD